MSIQTLFSILVSGVLRPVKGDCRNVWVANVDLPEFKLQNFVSVEKSVEMCYDASSGKYNCY